MASCKKEDTPQPDTVNIVFNVYAYKFKLFVNAPGAVMPIKVTGISHDPDATHPYKRYYCVDSAYPTPQTWVDIPDNGIDYK